MTRYPTVPLFDVVMDAIVPTMTAGADEQRDAFAAEQVPTFTRRFGTFGGDYWTSWRDVHGVELNEHEFDVLLTIDETCNEGNYRARARRGGWRDGADYAGRDQAYYWLTRILLAR